MTPKADRTLLLQESITADMYDHPRFIAVGKLVTADALAPYLLGEFAFVHNFEAGFLKKLRRVSKSENVGNPETARLFKGEA